MTIRLSPHKGLTILNKEILWGGKRDHIRELLQIEYSEVEKGNRFSWGVKFDDYHDVEINGTEAKGHSFQLGYNKNDELIEFSAIWDFQILIDDFQINYCESYDKMMTKMNSFEWNLIPFASGAFMALELGLILAKSPETDEHFNKGKMVEYVYSTKDLKKVANTVYSK